MRFRIATGDVCLIELQRRIPYVFWHFLSLRQLLQQIRHRVAPDYRPHSLKERLDRFFGGLLRGETGPIIKCPLDIAAGMLPVSSGLIHPVLHCVPCLRPSAAPTPDNLMTLGIVRPWLGCSQGVRSARPRTTGVCQPIAGCTKIPQPTACASAASAWGSQKVMSMARYSAMAVVSSARAGSGRSVLR